MKQRLIANGVPPIMQEMAVACFLNGVGTAIRAMQDYKHISMATIGLLVEFESLIQEHAPSNEHN